MGKIWQESQIMEITDYTSPKLRIVNNFITQEECDYIISYADSLNLWSHDNKPKDTMGFASTWDDRVVNINKLYVEYKSGDKSHVDFLKFTHDVQSRMKDLVIDFFKMEYPIYSESWECARWGLPYHNEQTPHIDYLDKDFTLEEYDKSNVPEASMGFMTDNMVNVYKTHLTSKNFTSMLYLNRDFEGGDLYFPQHNNFTVSPGPGVLAIFSGDLNHFHGITPITSGLRYTHTTFWSKDIDRSSSISLDKYTNQFDVNFS